MSSIGCTSRDGIVEEGSVEEWHLIESDPAVFTDLCNLIGVKNIEFKEILGADKETFEELTYSTIGPVLGFIFLFKWVKESPTSTAITDAQPDSNTNPDDQLFEPELFFAKQVIQNACATQAILSVLLNQPSTIEIGAALQSLKEFSRDFDPFLRGLAISNSQPIREAHNSFKCVRCFEVVDDSSQTCDDNFHYIAYVPFKNKLFELDGLKNHPIDLGSYDGEHNWIHSAVPAINQRIADVQKNSKLGELRFNLLAVTTDQETQLNRRLGKLTSLQTSVESAIAADTLIENRDIAVATDSSVENPSSCTFPLVQFLDNDYELGSNAPSLPESVLELNKLLKEIEALTVHVQAKIYEEILKKTRWGRENCRRRFDFIPVILAALKHLARTDELLPALEAAK